MVETLSKIFEFGYREKRNIKCFGMEEKLENKIKLQIKELRKIRNVTQKDVAEAIHVSFQTVSKWENGVAMPDIEYLPLLAMYFDVDVEVLLGMRRVELKPETVDFSEKEFWDAQIESTKNWKLFYFNDDYLEFLVRQVWKFDRPVKMLDCACGYGYLAEKIFPCLPEGSSYTGFDISEKYLDEARKRFGSDNPAIQFQYGNVLDFQSDEKYDLVISQMILSYLPEPEKVVKDMVRLLKPGGMLVSIDISIPLAESGVYIASGDETYKPQIPSPEKVWECLEQQGEMNIRLGAKMAMLFRHCGLKHIETRLSDRVFVYDAGAVDSENKSDRKAEMYKYKDVLEHMERFQEKYDFYMNRGCTLLEAEAFVKYQEDVLRMLEEPDVFVSKASGLYITWGEI